MEELKKRMMNPSQICKMQSQLPMAGYLYCQEKCKWTKNNHYTFHFSFINFMSFTFALFVSLIFSSREQGLWGCHGWNITAGITRRAGCSPWCPVSRSLQPNRYWNEGAKQQEGQRRTASYDFQDVVSAAHTSSISTGMLIVDIPLGAALWAETVKVNKVKVCLFIMTGKTCRGSSPNFIKTQQWKRTRSNGISNHFSFKR